MGSFFKEDRMIVSPLKVVLAFFGLAFIIQAHAYLPDQFKGGQKTPTAFLIVLNEDKTPRCKLEFESPAPVKHNVFVEGLRKCDQSDVAYLQTLEPYNITKAGVGGGKVMMGLTALVLAVGNAVWTCWSNLKYIEKHIDEYEKANPGEEISDELSDDLGNGAIRSIWRGGLYGLVYAGLGVSMWGKKALLASTLWGLGIQVPVSYGAGYACSEGLKYLANSPASAEGP